MCIVSLGIQCNFVLLDGNFCNLTAFPMENEHEAGICISSALSHLCAARVNALDTENIIFKEGLVYTV